MAQIKLTILLRDVGADRYPEVVEACRRVGFIVESELLSIGVIVGCIDEARMPALAAIDGVAAVEPEKKHRAL